MLQYHILTCRFGAPHLGRFPEGIHRGNTLVCQAHYCSPLIGRSTLQQPRGRAGRALHRLAKTDLGLGWSLCGGSSEIQEKSLGGSRRIRSIIRW